MQDSMAVILNSQEAQMFALLLNIYGTIAICKLKKLGVGNARPAESEV